jgi:hypothetical protein
MVQINIDISIFDNQLLRRTFTYIQKPQHTRVVVVLYTTNTGTGGNDTSVCVHYTTFIDSYGIFYCSLH